MLSLHVVFFFNDTATTEIYTLSLHDALPISDLARAFYLAAKSERTNEIYNLGAGSPQPVNRLVELLGGEAVRLPKRPEPKNKRLNSSQNQTSYDVFCL